VRRNGHKGWQVGGGRNKGEKEKKREGQRFGKEGEGGEENMKMGGPRGIKKGNGEYMRYLGMRGAGKGRKRKRGEEGTL
jgi:hypothetical protein